MKMDTVAVRTVRLGDWEIARIGLGTNRLARTASNVEFVREAVAAGVGLIDTAHVYAGGQSEQAIGEALSAAPVSCVVATKGGYAPGHGRPEVLRQQVEESLRRLRVDTIGLYYLHRVDPETPFEDSLGVIKEYQDAGRIGLAGVSAVDVEQIERARQVLPIAAVQNQYNPSDRGYDEVVDYCTREGIVFVPYYPLHGHPPAVAEIAERHGATRAQVALAWLLRRSPVVLPIPGSLSPRHVRENLAALDLELTDEEFAAIA